MCPHGMWGLHRAFLKIKFNNGCTGISAVFIPFAPKPAFTSVKTHWKAQSCWHSFALPAWDAPEMEQGLAPGWAELREAMTGWAWQGPGAGCSLCFGWVILTWPFYCKSVGVQDGKGTFPKWIQNTYYQTEFEPRNKYLSTGEKISYNFWFPHIWIFFFEGKFVSKIIVWIKT